MGGGRNDGADNTFLPLSSKLGSLEHLIWQCSSSEDLERVTRQGGFENVKCLALGDDDLIQSSSRPKVSFKRLAEIDIV